MGKNNGPDPGCRDKGINWRFSSDECDAEHIIGEHQALGLLLHLMETNGINRISDTDMYRRRITIELVRDKKTKGEISWVITAEPKGSKPVSEEYAQAEDLVFGALARDNNRLNLNDEIVGELLNKAMRTILKKPHLQDL